jgi:hypothetical protein
MAQGRGENSRICGLQSIEKVKLKKKRKEKEVREQI